MMKKWIALLLAALLSLSLFAGCAKKDSQEDAASNGEADAETEPAGTEAPTESGDPAETEPADPIAEALKTRSHYSEDDVAYDDPRLDEIAARCGDDQLTNRQLQFYYHMAYMNFMSSYGMYAEYFGIDATQPLSGQASLVEGLSWEQFFLQNALEEYHQNAAVTARAKAEGYALPQESEDYLASLPEELTKNAQSSGFATVTEYLQDAFGPGVDLEDYLEYARNYFYVTGYENEVYRNLSFSDEEIEAYYDQNADSFAEQGITKDNDQQTIDVRHILVTPEDADGDGVSTDEEWAAAEAEARALLDEYLKNPTEANFATMANEHSADPGSNTNGGLYEMVLPGQMVDTFNDWCFNEERLVGDTGIVKTTYGYHIMYFVQRNATPYWMAYTLANGLRNDKMSTLIRETADATPLVLQPERILVASIKAEG